MSSIDQKRLIEATDWDYLVICDGGRADVFENAYQDHLDGDYTRAWNRDHGFTATWFAEMFDGEYDAWCYHGGLPIHEFVENPADYDEREHFAEVANYGRYEWDEDFRSCPPEGVTRLVAEDGPQQAVIRYLQPHNPYRDLGHIGGRADAQRYESDVLYDAYRDNFEWVLSEIANGLVPLLHGTVVVTADHGQCLGDCGQYLHHRDHDRHDHLVEVPWLEVDAPSLADGGGCVECWETMSEHRHNDA